MTDITSREIEDLRTRLANEIAAETARQEWIGAEPKRGVIWWEEKREGRWLAFCAIREGSTWMVRDQRSMVGSTRWPSIVDELKRLTGYNRVCNVVLLPVEIDAEEEE